MNRGDFNVGDWPFGAIELLRPYDDWQSLAPVAVIRACPRTASATTAVSVCKTSAAEIPCIGDCVFDEDHCVQTDGLMMNTFKKRSKGKFSCQRARYCA